MHAPNINYWKTHKPVRFVLSFVLSIRQQYKQRTEFLQSIYVAIMEFENTENIFVKHAPYLDTWKP